MTVLQSIDVAPISGKPWYLARQTSVPPQFIEAFVPTGDAVEVYQEMLSLESLGGVSALPALADYTAQIGSSIRPMVTDGDFRIESEDAAASGSATLGGIILTWSVAGDTLLEDQFEVQLLTTGPEGVRIIRYTGRAEPTKDRVESARRLALSAQVDWEEHWSARAAAPTPELLSGEDFQQILAALQKPLRLPPPPAEELYRSLMSAVRRDLQPQQWAVINSLLGIRLLEAPHVEGAKQVKIAIGALRRALEAIGRPEKAWAPTVLTLGRGYAELMEYGEVEAAARAEKAFRHARAGFIEAGNAIDAARASVSVARLRLNSPNVDSQSLLEALEMLREASQTVSVTETPMIWVDLNTLLGDAHLALARFEGKMQEKSAEESYRRVFEALTEQEIFTTVDEDEFSSAYGIISWKILQLDRAGIPEPIRSPGWSERETWGKILFLRPLDTAGRLLVPNQFRHPENFSVRFEVEPDPITVEAALYLVLGERFVVDSVGGRVDGFGSTRMNLQGGREWQSVFEVLIEAADLILMIPSGSDGVRWELNQLISTGRLGKCLFVQPPISTAMDVDEMWERSKKILADVQVQTPPFDPKGQLFRVGPNFQIADVIPFEAVWENTLTNRLQDFKRRPPAPGKESAMKSDEKIGVRLTSPHSGKCEECQTEFIMALILIFDVDDLVPDFVKLRRMPSHECSVCGSITMVAAPLLAVNVRDEPPLLYVPMEGASAEANAGALDYVLTKLLASMPYRWRDEWLSRIQTLSRESLAAFIEARRSAGG